MTAMNGETRGIGAVKDQKPPEKEMVSDPCCLISEIPMPVLYDVFLKLAIKDVMRCKCVCTAWNKLLSEPIYSEDYAKNSPRSSILHSVDPYDIYSYPDSSYLFQIRENGGRIRAPFTPKLRNWLRELSGSLTFVGSCNGFLCMKVYQKPCVEVIYVANPLMGEPVALPERKRHGFGISVAKYNFGFSSSTNEYKVVRLLFRRTTDRRAGECEIFTLGVDDAWRPLPNSFEGLELDAACAALNGAFHWVGERKLDRRDVISTFNFGNESFGHISLPPSALLVPLRSKVAVFGNKLGLVDFFDCTHISIWKMEKYSVAESWNKVVVLTSWFPKKLVSSGLVSVLELKNGDLLFFYMAEKVVRVNLEQKKGSFIKMGGMGRRDYCSILTFTPNFSSSAESIMKGKRSTENVQSEDIFHAMIYQASASSALPEYFS